MTTLIASKPGHFWCYTHLADLPLSEQSLDPRFCRACCDFLNQEAKDGGIRRGKRAPWWLPVIESTHQMTSDAVLQGRGIMSTVNDQKTEVDIIHPTPTTRRGPKSHTLPVEKIRQLALSGMGSKSIASKLQGEGLSVSCKTIQRRLRRAVTA